MVSASWTSKTLGIRPICFIEQPPASHQQPASSKLEVSSLQQDRLGGVRGGCARIGGLGVTLTAVWTAAKPLFPSTFDQTAREWCKSTLRIPCKTQGFEQAHTVKNTWFQLLGRQRIEQFILCAPSNTVKHEVRKINALKGVGGMRR